MTSSPLTTPGITTHLQTTWQAVFLYIRLCWFEEMVYHALGTAQLHAVGGYVHPHDPL